MNRKKYAVSALCSKEEYSGFDIHHALNVWTACSEAEAKGLMMEVLEQQIPNFHSYKTKYLVQEVQNGNV